MRLCDYMAMAEGYELRKQKDLVPLRHFVWAIVSSNGAKIRHEQLYPLTLLDRSDTDRTQQLVNRLFEKELKRKRNGNGSQNKSIS